MSITSTEFFINMRSIPDDKSEEYDAFFQEELRKINYGVTINGIYIHGWLYWHLNHWHIWKDTEDSLNKVIRREFLRPDLRDNEWLISEKIHQAETERKGLLLFGTRRAGKTEFEASWTGRGATIYKGSQNVICGGNESDIKLICNSLDLGLVNLHPYFVMPRVEDNWKKEVALGIKDKYTGARYVHSRILIRNLKNGLASEAAAGTTPKNFIIDEVGKFPFAEALAAAKPSFTSPFGWRCVPILTGTGGSFDDLKDAKEMFEDPEAHNFLGVPLAEQGGKIYGMFMSGRYRMEAKVLTTLGNYLEIPDKDSELYNVKMHVKDDDKADEIINNERALAARSNDPKELPKAIMYYPRSPEECFMSGDVNDFPVELLRKQLSFLKERNIKADNVELHLNETNKIYHKFTDKKPVYNFPAKPGDVKDGVVQIWEYPIDNAPYGLYVAGTDPYKQSEAQYSTSLGSTFIYKRIHNITTEGFQDIMVACYCGRPKKIEKWYENTKHMLAFYNAKTLCENEDYGFIQHLVDKNEAFRYFAKKPDFIREIHPNSSVTREYGIHSTPKINNYLVGLIKQYCLEVIDFQKDDNGNTIGEILGVTRILDPMLLEEMLQFNPTGNFDRIRAFGLALAYASSMSTNVVVSDKQDKRLEEYQKLGTRNSLLIPLKSKLFKPRRNRWQ